MSSAVLTGARIRSPRVATVVTLVTLLATSVLLPARATVDGGGSGHEDDDEAHGLLARAREATTWPHDGSVTIVSFTERGPRVAELEVTVEDTDAMLRRVLVEPSDPVGRVPALGARSWQRVPTSPLGLDVDAILARWDVRVGVPVDLDTGPATPVHLVRRAGAAIRESLYVDEATGIAVRRETRAADGSVLRVAAYTRLDARDQEVHVDDRRTTAARRWGVAEGPTGVATATATARAAGFEFPPALAAGFVLVAVTPDDEEAVARYSDGLSVVSVYQQPGALDAGALDGAIVRHVAGRDVWSWPGSEPVRYVWTGGGMTWIAVSDAPSPVIDDALASLPGDLVGHDAGHRLRRGLNRVWRFVTTPLR